MEYRQNYSRGKPVTTLTSHALPVELKDQQGTCIKFWPDKEGLHLPFKLWFNVNYLIKHIYLEKY